MVARVVETGLPLIYLNMVGAQDDQIFDGASFALNPHGELAMLMPAFDEEIHAEDLAEPIELERLRAFDLGRVLEMDPAFFQQKGTLFSVSREQRRHDTTVVSVGFERAGELQMERTNAWIGKLLQVAGAAV